MFRAVKLNNTHFYQYFSILTIINLLYSCIYKNESFKYKLSHLIYIFVYYYIIQVSVNVGESAIVIVNEV